MKLFDPGTGENPQQTYHDAFSSATLAYVKNCIGNPDIQAIRNIRTRLLALDSGSHLFPVSVNDGGELENNSYVVSPLNAYTGYAHEELRRLQHPWLTAPLGVLINIVGMLLKAAQIDRLVQVNNWLLSTNVYPPGWQGEELPAMTDFLVNRFPDHAISFRSLNRFSNEALIERLLSLGYVAIPSRQVYLFDARAGDQAPFSRRHNVKNDMALLRRKNYRVITGDALTEADFERLEHLYNLVYVDKYCHLNPQFTAAWLRCGQRDGWLDLRALQRPDGVIDGVIGFFDSEEIQTAPLVGYDTALPQSLGLYRRLARIGLQAAMEKRMLFNCSSGAAHFKRMRGGEPEIEITAIYVRHLPAFRRLTWILLGKVLWTVAVPLVRRLKL